MKKVHLISIGGIIMHSLAIWLKKEGYEVTGSDDEIFGSARASLKDNDLLPLKDGWFEDKITENIDFIILGTHAKKNNPELVKAKSLGIKIYSYPEYISSLIKNKHRIVVAGSYGKTSTVAMVMHVLKKTGKKFDYLIGGKLDGFESSISFSEDSSIAILEGDEYISSAEDVKPKFSYYEPHLLLLTGIKWDHVNAYSNYESYLSVFKNLISSLDKGGMLIYNDKDKELDSMSKIFDSNIDISAREYKKHKGIIKDGIIYLSDPIRERNRIPLSIVGGYNLENITAAKLICLQLGVKEKTFYDNISSFKGVNLRMQKIIENDKYHVFRDFAHAPYKVCSAIKALKKQFPYRKLIACFELHTYSTLDKNFIRNYKNTVSSADQALIYYNKSNSKNSSFSTSEIKLAFGRKDIILFSKIRELLNYVRSLRLKNSIVLVMSSGNFGSMDINKLLVEILK